MLISHHVSYEGHDPEVFLGRKKEHNFFFWSQVQDTLIVEV